MQEIWKDVVGWEGYYLVSNLGQVKSKERVMFYKFAKNKVETEKKVKEKIRKQKFNKSTGYMMINLNKDGFMKCETVHSMVAKAFIGTYEKGYTVNHKDGNKLNNNLENLEIITHRENCFHAFKNNLKSNNHKLFYENKEYYSKAEFRRETKIPEKRMNKMIEQGLIKVL